jgi:hypothetical protein
MTAEVSMRAVPILATAALVLIASGMPTWAVKEGAVLVASEGSVFARTGNRPRWFPASVRAAYLPGDALLTGRRSRAEVAFADGTITRMAPVSILQIPKQTTPSLGRLLFGRVWMKVSKQHAPISLTTPSAVATVVGTELTVSVDGEDNTRVACMEGAVKVQGLQGPEILLKPGQSVEVRMGAAVEAPQTFDVARWRSGDPMLVGLKQTRETADDDPDGYKTLLKQLGDDPAPGDPGPGHTAPQPD